jgi:hypothetical protein
MANRVLHILEVTSQTLSKPALRESLNLFSQIAEKSGIKILTGLTKFGNLLPFFVQELRPGKQ